MPVVYNSADNIFYLVFPFWLWFITTGISKFCVLFGSMLLFHVISQTNEQLIRDKWAKSVREQATNPFDHLEYNLWPHKRITDRFPLKIWRSELVGYFEYNYIIDGISFGFKIGVDTLAEKFKHYVNDKPHLYHCL